ncbi:MAG TPA: VWA domain-containing protein [Anaerolineales bacterium]|nr:VWA domain-containing protein [Anaerolineales bacterium]
MSFLTPLFLVLSALAAPIIILYMLKLRRRETEISSIMLWRMVLRDREANSPWQKLRRNLLLLLQLLLLALLVLALARPFIPVPVVATGQITVLLDASASMNATDVQPSRFEEAQKIARGLANDLTAESLMTLIVVGPQPEVLMSASNDKNELLNAIDAAQPTLGVANWEAAFALAAGANGSVANSTTVLISDGGLSENLPPLTGEVRYVPVGRESANLAVSALSIRPGPGGPQIFASVANYGDQEETTILTLNLDRELFNAQQLTVPPGKTSNVILTGYEGVVTAEAILTPPAGATAVDYLPTDDRGYAVYNPPQSGRVLFLSGKGNIYIEQLLAAFPGIQPFRAPVDAPLPSDPFDLYVFDGAVSSQLPPKELLLINPPANALFPVGESFQPEAGSLISLAEDDPLANFVDLRNVHILQARETQTPAWARTLASIDGKPLIFYGTIDRRRVVVFTFDLRDSDLPLQVAYPILMSNLIEWLTPSTVISAETVVHPGDSVTVRPAVGEQAVGILGPDDTLYTAGVTNAGALFAQTQLIGIYGVGTASQIEGTKFAGFFAVNLFDRLESNIQPADTLTIGRSQVSASVRNQVGQREFWPYVAAAALAILLVEWWVYHRGSSLPAVSGWRGWLQRKKAGT